MNTDIELMQQALEHVQEFKRLWWQVPAFGNKVNKATREAITKAHSQIFELEHSLHAALAEQPAEQEPVAWQRIETAPKTGRKVILFYLNRNNFPRTVMARWLTDDEAAETDTDCVGLEGGWYECIDNWDDYTEVAIHEGEPTHWMPLPPAPTVEVKPDAA